VILRLSEKLLIKINVFIISILSSICCQFPTKTGFPVLFRGGIGTRTEIFGEKKTRSEG
jgi:hypothetical protein